MNHLIHQAAFPIAILSILGAGIYVNRHNNQDYAMGYGGASSTRIFTLLGYALMMFGIAAIVFASTK